jgi:hypothetical protein
MDDAGAHHIVWIGIDAVEELHAKAGKFVLGSGQIEWSLSLKHLLCSLLLAAGRKKFRNCSAGNYHAPTHPPRFFHRAKNDSPFISVGSKNLLTVNGSLMMKFCGVPL